MIVITSIIEPARNTCTPISEEERSGERIRGDGVDGGVIQDLENNDLARGVGTEFMPFLLLDSSDGSNRREVKSARYPENSCRFGTPAANPKASAKMVAAMVTLLNLLRFKALNNERLSSRHTELVRSAECTKSITRLVLSPPSCRAAK